MASFTIQLSSENPLQVEFNGSGSAPGSGTTIQDYFWIFGDGTSQHSEQPSIPHTYSRYGSYLATLTVTNSCHKSALSEAVPINLICQDAHLAGISLSQGKFEPQFDPEIEFYQADVSYETEAITITPITTCPNLPIKIGDIFITSGNASPPIPLEVGINTIRLTTLSPEGEILKSYILNIRRSAPTDTSLLFSGLTIDPNPFSPAWSPQVKDITKIGGKLNREIPLYIRFYSEGELVDKILPKDINRYQGANIAHMSFDRSQWNGFCNGALPSQVYDIEVSTPVQLIRQTGTLGQEQKAIIFQPQALIVDNNNLIIASEGCPLQLLSPTGDFIRFLGKENLSLE